MKVVRLYTDGAARGNPGPAGLGLVVEDSEGNRLWGGCRYLGIATNNRAEYMALIEGLTALAKWSPERVEVFMDSKLVVEQINGRYRVKHPDLKPLHAKAQSLLAAFPEHAVIYVPREKNRGADHLANRAIDEYRSASG